MTEVSIYTEHRMAEGESLGKHHGVTGDTLTRLLNSSSCLLCMLSYAGRQGARVWLARYSPPDANPRRWTVRAKTRVFASRAAVAPRGVESPPGGTPTGGLPRLPHGFHAIFLTSEIMAFRQNRTWPLNLCLMGPRGPWGANIFTLSVPNPM